MIDLRGAITHAYCEEWARVLAALAKRFDNLDIAESGSRGVCDGRCEVAGRGVPANPGA